MSLGTHKHFIKISRGKETPNTREEILVQHAQERSRCMVYTRVMGYHRPVESFNHGKTGEHHERVMFKERVHA